MSGEYGNKKPVDQGIAKPDTKQGYKRVGDPRWEIGVWIEKDKEVDPQAEQIKNKGRKTIQQIQKWD